MNTRGNRLDRQCCLAPQPDCDFQLVGVVLAPAGQVRVLPGRFLTRFGQRLDEVLAAGVVQGDLLPPIAPAHQMIHRAGIFDAHLARHGVKLARPA
jgi:hypothetical protein